MIWVLGYKTTEMKYHFHHVTWHLLSMLPITCDTDLDHLSKVVFVRFIHCFSHSHASFFFFMLLHLFIVSHPFIFKSSEFLDFLSSYCSVPESVVLKSLMMIVDTSIYLSLQFYQFLLYAFWSSYSLSKHLEVLYPLDELNPLLLWNGCLYPFLLCHIID